MAKKQVVAALLAETSQEWMIAAQASMSCGLTLTTVYATLGHDAMLHGLQQTEAEVIFMDFSLFDTLKDEVLAKCPALRHIIFIGKDLIPHESSAPGHKPFPTPPQAAEIPAINAAHCTTLDNVIAHGYKEQVDLAAVAPTPQDVAMIMYDALPPSTVCLTTSSSLDVQSVVPEQNASAAQDLVLRATPLRHVMP